MKEKEIQKVKSEKRIPYHEAKKLVNMYNVPKPYLPSYATVVKSSMKDMSTQVCESDIPSQTSVTTKTNPVPFQVKQTSTSPGSSSTSGKSVATTSAEPVAADIPQSKRRNSSPKK